MSSDVWKGWWVKRFSSDTHPSLHSRDWSTQAMFLSYITSKHLPKSSLNLLAFPAPKEADDSSEGVKEKPLWGIFLALHLSAHDWVV